VELIQDQTFSKVNFTANPLPKAEYDNCTFADCIFADANIENITFTECTFEGCNLSMAQTGHTALKNVKFINCKMTGFNFSHCDPFLLQVEFDECILQLASFYRLKLKNTNLNTCDLREADFTEADLTSASLNGCDLTHSIFQDTNLEKADLRNATNYSIDPEMNRLKKAKFSRDNIAGLLDKYQIVIE
jgi:uncharacterized protein YjbI with pentapeptide repeats